MRVKSILLAELRSISRAPLSFAVTILAAALIMWVAMNRQYERSELKEAVAQRDEYREKLKGASPDQAANRISHLEDELAALQTSSISPSMSKENVWPTLTPGQIASLSEILRRYPVRSLAVFFVDKNSESFRGSLNEVFRRALWPTPVVDAVNSVDGKGITVRSRPNEGPAFALASLLRGMGYQVSHVTDAENTAGGFQLYILNRPQ